MSNERQKGVSTVERTNLPLLTCLERNFGTILRVLAPCSTQTAAQKNTRRPRSRPWPVIAVHTAGITIPYISWDIYSQIAFRTVHRHDTTP